MPSCLCARLAICKIALSPARQVGQTRQQQARAQERPSCPIHLEYKVLEDVSKPRSRLVSGSSLDGDGDGGGRAAVVERGDLDARGGGGDGVVCRVRVAAGGRCICPRC